MANTPFTSSVILNRFLAALAETPTFINSINRQYDDSFAGRGAQYGLLGDTVRIRVPQHAVIRTGRTMDTAPVQDKTISVALSSYAGVDLAAASLEMTLDFDQWAKLYIDPKVPDLVAYVENQVLQTVLPQIQNVVNGAAGPLNATSIPLQAGRFLDNHLAPRDQRNFLLNTGAQTEIIPALQGLFAPQTAIGSQYNVGRMGHALGFDWETTSLMPNMTTGSRTALYVLNGVPASGATTAVVATGTGTMTVGDVFTMAGVFDVQAQTKTAYGYLKQFTVSAAYAGGAGTISFQPPIVTSGSEQNVSAAPASNAALTFQGALSSTFAQNIAYTKDAFYLVTADLAKPGPGMGVDVATKNYGGLNIRCMQGFDMVNDTFLTRLDVAFGSGILRPEFSVRVPSDLI